MKLLDYEKAIGYFLAVLRTENNQNSLLNIAFCKQ